MARMKSIVPGRALDDDFTVLAELNNGAIATITASQITIGAQNDNGFRIIGTTGTLVWSHTHFDGPGTLRRRTSQSGSTARGPITATCRPRSALPAASRRAIPEGFHEALANLHRTLEWTIRRSRGEPARSRSTTPASPTAWPAWPSSRPPSRAPAKASGWTFRAGGSGEWQWS